MGNAAMNSTYSLLYYLNRNTRGMISRGNLISDHGTLDCRKKRMHRYDDEWMVDTKTGTGQTGHDK